MSKVLDGRAYNEWSNERGSSGEKLNRLPPITTTLSNGKRYYSTSDAELFFGNIYIDEVTDIMWQETQNSMPIYGYNSYCFDDIAVGTRLVQGQFSINYTKSNYLGLLQNSAGFAEIARRQYGKDYAETSYFSDYRKRLNLPKWDKGFDLVVGFGYHHTSIGKVSENNTSSYVVIDCCQITGSSQRLNYVGEPVQEVYSFIARDIKYAKATADEMNPSRVNGTDGDTSQNDQVGTEFDLVGEIDLNNKTISLTAVDNVEFTSEGTIHLRYPFEDKTLQAEMVLVSNRKEATASLSSTFVNKVKKELDGKTIKGLPASYSVSMSVLGGEKPVAIKRKGEITLTIV